MNEKIDLNRIFLNTLQNFVETKDITVSLTNIISEELSSMSEYINFEIIQNYIAQDLIENQTLKKLDDKNEVNHTLNNTLKEYNYDFSFEQKEIFKELIKYDLSCTMNNKQVFYKLNLLLETIFSHLETLEKLYSLEKKELHEKGIAKTPHPKVKNAISPRINHIEESIKYNPTESNEQEKIIYEEFDDNPEEIAAMYAIIIPFGKDIFKNISQEKLDTLFNQSVFLNSAVKLEDYHIYTSCQITSFSIYKKDKISNEKLAKLIDSLLKEFFDEVFSKPLTRHHIPKETQVKSFFNGIAIYEYRTKSNFKEHPIFKC